MSTLFDRKPSLFVFAAVTEDGQLALLPWQKQFSLPFQVGGDNSHGILLRDLLSPYFRDISLSKESVVEILGDFWFEGTDHICHFYSFRFKGALIEIRDRKPAALISPANIPDHMMRIEFSGIFRGFRERFPRLAR